MHEDIDLIIYYKDMQIEELNKLLNKLKEDLKAQYPDLFLKYKDMQIEELNKLREDLIYQYDDLFPNKNECEK